MFGKIFINLLIVLPLCWSTPVLKIGAIYNNSLVWIQDTHNATIRDEIIVKYNQFLDSYTNLVNYGDKIDDCSKKSKADEGKFCHFDIQLLGRCNKNQLFGLHRAAPCIFLYLDNIDGWNPQTYEPNNLPTKLTSTFDENILNQYKNKSMVWLQCEGVYPADKELIGPLAYYPQPGFETKYITSQKLNGYHGPLVGMMFQRVMTGVVINIRCQIFAPNIPQDKSTLTFDFILDYSY